MGTILCHLETHLRKLTLVGSLNEEGTSDCKRCYRSDQNKEQESKENGDKTIFYLSTENKTLTEEQSLYLSLYSSKATYKEKPPPVQSEKEGLKNYRTNRHQGISFFGGGFKNL